MLHKTLEIVESDSDINHEALKTDSYRVPTIIYQFCLEIR